MVQSNLKDFLKEVEQKVKAYEKERYKWCVDNILMANKMLVGLSPVSTGLFRANHIPTYNTKTNRTKESTDVELIDLSDAKFKNGDTITIQNNLAYADALEAGHSTQAPAGVYGITEERMRIKINKKVKV